MNKFAHALAALAATGSAAVAQQAVTIEIQGTVQLVDTAPAVGPFSSAAAGDAWSLTCDVLLDSPSVSGSTTLFVLESSTLDVISAGGSEGSPQAGFGNFGITTGASEGFSFASALESNTTLYIYAINSPEQGVFPTSDLLALDGTYSSTEFGFVSGAVSNDTAYLELGFDTLTITAGPPASGAIGSSFCSSNANSSGNPALLSAVGSELVSQNDLTLNVAQAPAGTFGLFIVSKTQGAPSGVSLGSGLLCISGSIGRFDGPGQIVQTDASGSVSLGVDLMQVPSSSSSYAAAPGDSLHFQFWFRDAAANGQGSFNLTQGLKVDFM